MTIILCAIWVDKPMEYPNGSELRIPPNPDLVVGFRDFKSGFAVDSLRAYVFPVECKKNLTLPFFALEAKHLQASDYALRQCQIDGATMLRNLREAHKTATSEESCREEFDKMPLVFTAAISKEIVALCVHWTEIVNDTIQYNHSIVKWLTRKHDWELVVNSLRNAIDLGFSMNEIRVVDDLETINNAIRADRIHQKLIPFPRSANTPKLSPSGI